MIFPFVLALSENLKCGDTNIARKTQLNSITKKAFRSSIVVIVGRVHYEGKSECKV